MMLHRSPNLSYRCRSGPRVHGHRTIAIHFAVHFVHGHSLRVAPLERCTYFGGYLGIVGLDFLSCDPSPLLIPPLTMPFPRHIPETLFRASLVFLLVIVIPSPRWPFQSSPKSSRGPRLPQCGFGQINPQGNLRHRLRNLSLPVHNRHLCPGGRFSLSPLRGRRL
ncbi:hypothetical protein BJV77DRAFT_627318 [Russula vinacea]|nr:hypothetical protein BJV77DRAFT_627318 [Russula vinacea]